MRGRQRYFRIPGVGRRP